MSIVEVKPSKSPLLPIVRFLVIVAVTAGLILGVIYVRGARQTTTTGSPSVATPVAMTAAAPVRAPVAKAASAAASPTATSDQTSNMGYLDQLTHEQDFCNCGH
jgi:hypothetical protein